MREPCRVQRQSLRRITKIALVQGGARTARYGANGREPARPAHQYQLTSKTATGSAKSALQSGCQYCYVRPVRQNNAPLLRGRIDMAETTERWPSQHIKRATVVGQPLEYLADSVNVTSKRCSRTTRRYCAGTAIWRPQLASE